MTDQDPDEALKIYRETHETFDDDIFVLSYLTFDEAQFETRGIAKEPVFIPVEDLSFDDRLEGVEQAPTLPVKELDDDRVHRSNLDWVVEATDSPQPLPPVMQGRVLKAADIARGDIWMMNRRNKKKY